MENLRGDISNININVHFHSKDGVMSTSQISKGEGISFDQNAKRHDSSQNSVTSLYSDRLDEHGNAENASRSSTKIYEEHKDNANFYQMTHFYKGRVLIINNNFTGTQNMRRGSGNDVRALNHLFNYIGSCSVMTMKDLTAEGILSAVKSFAECKIEQGFCAVFIMSHGEAVRNRDVVLGSDYTRVNAKELVDSLKSSLYPHLKEVPVLVFFQMCRGTLYDRSTDHHRRVENHVPDKSDAAGDDDENRWLSDTLSKILPGGMFLGQKNFKDDVADATISGGSQSNKDNTDERESKHIGNEPNMMVSFSTMEGYKSFRNEEFGSWFIQSICKNFKSFAHQEDVIALMNRVHDAIADKAAKCQGDMGGSRVCSRTIHTFGQKKLHFFPGLP